MSKIDISGMTDWEVDQWSSHRLILAPLLREKQFYKIVECGGGVFSTEGLADASTHLVSLESEQIWVDKLQEHLEHRSDIELVLKEPPFARWLASYDPFGLLFVDHSGDRGECVEEGMRLNIPYIVMHDFTVEEELGITIKPGYYLYTTRDIHFNPTALYTNDAEMYLKFDKGEMK